MKKDYLKDKVTWNRLDEHVRRLQEDIKSLQYQDMSQNEKLKSLTSNIIFKLNNNLEDVNIIILSDSTGDSEGEWAYIISQYLATNFPSYTVNFRHWNINSLEYQPIDPVQTGNIQNPKTLNIYLGGASGQGLAYGNANFDSLFPIKPDLVMISYGHNDNYANSQLYITEYLKLTKRIQKTFTDTNIILIGQNPKDRNLPTFENGVKNVKDIIYIASREGYGFVNIMQHFFDYGDYTTDLLSDGIHPNAVGSQYWADFMKPLFDKDNFNVYLTSPKFEPESIFIPPSQLTSSSSSLSYISKPGDVKLPTINLTPDEINGVFATIMLPYYWKTLNVYVLWTTDSDSSSSQVYFNSYGYFLDDTISNPDLDNNSGAFRFVNGATSGKVNKTQIYSYLGSGEYELEKKNFPFVFSITRLGNNVNDTLTEDCRILGVIFERRT